ncbi:MAG: glycosyltransferase family 92 protein [Deltaproteobacteria bacterium]|jgi:hypothetical protein|nr:glycosyltransferase family 92 protein [Deltaproteobacteria bacterium]
MLQKPKTEIYLAILAALKNEASYIKEWLEYHLLVGVERFYLYDNESSDNLREVLQPYISAGLVVYEFWQGKAQQVEIYKHAVEKYKYQTRWMAIIDADEFIVPIQANNIPKFLKDFEQYPAVVINWVQFDTNRHKTRPAGLVIENYTRIHADKENVVSLHVKSIVNPLKVRSCNIHNQFYLDGELAVTENFEPILEGVYQTEYLQRHKIQLNHYWSKSEEELRIKIERGRASVKEKRTMVPQDWYIYEHYKFNYTIFKYLPKLRGKMGFKFPNLGLAKQVYRILLNSIDYLFHNVLFYGKNAINLIVNKTKINQGVILVKQSSYFNSFWYRTSYPYRITKIMFPAKHYFKIGWKQNLNPSLKFSTQLYLDNNLDVKQAGLNPLYHYEKYGKQEGRSVFSVEK